MNSTNYNQFKISMSRNITNNVISKTFVTDRECFHYSSLIWFGCASYECGGQKSVLFANATISKLFFLFWKKKIFRRTSPGDIVRFLPTKNTSSLYARRHYTSSECLSLCFSFIYSELPFSAIMVLADVVIASQLSQLLTIFFPPRLPSQ